MSASTCKEHQTGSCCLTLSPIFCLSLSLLELNFMLIDSRLAYHLSLLKLDSSNDQSEKACLAPIFTGFVLRQPELAPSQYGLLGGVKNIETSGFASADNRFIEKDPRLFFNVSSPSSTFICGSQGSGKSHTLSCILEGCLIPSQAGRLLNPLTAVIFHYDTFICDNGGSPCEAAFLASHSNIRVRVLCAPTNLLTIQRTYSRFNIKVEPLQIDQANLSTKRMLDLMAVGQDSGPVPLYVHTVQRILREMRLLQQMAGSQFDYKDFKKRILSTGLLPGQLEPLRQRLDTLESFMAPQQTAPNNQARGKKAKSQGAGSNWTPKYMKDSVEAGNFTDNLLSTVRLQRHLGARILISTQEPTISSDLLSLCSVTIVHRFSSPAWIRALQGHVAGAALGLQLNQEKSASDDDHPGNVEISRKFSLFHRIVHLQVGEALLFSLGAVSGTASEGLQGLRNLGSGYMVIKIRDRLTEDGGKSVLSS
ncbi:uncharacterized protein N7506_000130 [Penicillium brevicompactum]|uniref:uncharacterized protein n=1 Tax=Penicillium brevicompactum TaxID=5074 RepID=UPI002541219B|nr:uncharacterized protein N7506_000130 [Penicillium brevicompactum]KAJ5346877.1 hypothetical protein N7506_000130 [Penicillium brevicompactum]